MTAEADALGGGDVSSPTEPPNSNAVADSSSISVGVNARGSYVGSVDPLVADLSCISVEVNGKRTVEDSAQSPITNDENKIESEKHEPLAAVSNGDTNHYNQHINVDLYVEDTAVESGTFGASDSVVPRRHNSSKNAETSRVALPSDTACEKGVLDLIQQIPAADSLEDLTTKIEQTTQVDSVSGEREKGIKIGLYHDVILETVIDDFTDPYQESAELDKPTEVGESIPSQIDSESSSVESIQVDLGVDASVSDASGTPDATYGNSAVTESCPSAESGCFSSFPDDVGVQNLETQSTVERDLQRCKNSEENVEIQFTGGDDDDLGCKEVVGNGEIQFWGEESDDQDCKKVEEGGKIQIIDEENDDQECKYLEEGGRIQIIGEESDDQECKELEEGGRIQILADESDGQECIEVEGGGIQSINGESDDKTFHGVEDNVKIYSNCNGGDDKTFHKVDGNMGGHATCESLDDKTCQKVEDNGGIQFTGRESDDKTCQEVEENRGMKFIIKEHDAKARVEVKENGGIQFTVGEDDDVTCQEVEGFDGSVNGEAQSSAPEGSMVNASKSLNVGIEVVHQPFYFLVKVPRYNNENLKEKINCAQSEVDEKTRSRDAIRDEIHTIRASYEEFAQKVETAISDGRNARELIKYKRQEIDSVQSRINRVKDAICIGDIDGKIRDKEHTIAHETIPLKEEKQIICDIQQLKQRREQISTSIGEQDQQDFEQKDKIEEQMKLLRREMDSLRENVIKAETATQYVKKLHREESEKLKKLISQFKAADEIRQEAYKQLQTLKKQAYDKNKHFRKYKDDAKQANALVFKGDRKELQVLCVNQVERVLKLWNSNDEFRKEYVKSNIRSTLRRLKTLDGRYLGLDEEAPVVFHVVNDIAPHNISLPQISIIGRVKEEQVMSLKPEKGGNEPVVGAREQRNGTANSKKTTKTSCPENVSAILSGRDGGIIETKVENPKPRIDEVEMARKAEEERKEEAAAKLREQRRLGEKAKAQEALERKKRIAEKAQARAAVRARKEAEQKEKEREKRARKKEKGKMAAIKSEEEESTPSLETPLRVPQSPELREKPAMGTKKSKRAPQLARQAKAKYVPLPLRNRGKRRMQSWMWVLMAAVIVFALFLLGNTSIFVKFGIRRFGF